MPAGDIGFAIGVRGVVAGIDVEMHWELDSEVKSIGG